MNESTLTQTRSTFSLTYRVEVNIRAKAERIWKILTDAKDFPRWNSTVTSIEGQIRDGEKITVRIPGTDRAFTLKVSDFVANEHMTFTGGFAPVFSGVRTFALKSRPDGTTDFTMGERFSGLMFPMIKGSLPDFGPIFARYASDLQGEAERA
jgi:uncharacterized protein YndB with AHSA1/START domain